VFLLVIKLMNHFDILKATLFFTSYTDNLNCEQIEFSLVDVPECTDDF
jgi:hypothetical protein